ncbi:MAG: hypothetical protein HYU36_00605 [Planctomycetes bacterium]|nr:hypothetical protein [Planctomycetota bacterium]
MAETSKDDVVFTQDGRPYAILKAIPAGIKLEGAFNETSARFRRMIQDRREERGIPWEEAKRWMNTHKSFVVKAG